MPAKTITKAEALRIFATNEETRCDVYCLPNYVIASVGKQWLDYQDLETMESAGLITIRLEEVPCPPMGERTPPIRHVSLTEAGRIVERITNDVYERVASWHARGCPIPKAWAKECEEKQPRPAYLRAGLPGFEP